MVPTFAGLSVTLSLATGQAVACLQLQEPVVHLQLTACICQHQV